MFKQYGNSFTLLLGYKKKTGKLVLAKLGHVKMVLHRPIKGKPKTAIVKRAPTGKWDWVPTRNAPLGTGLWVLRILLFLRTAPMA